MTETKAEKFERLRDLRLPKVLEALRIFGNIANPRDYDYTPEQAEAVIAELRAAIDSLALDFGLDPTRGQSTPSMQAVNTSQDIAVLEEKALETQYDPSDIDPDGPKSRIKEHDGKKLKVGAGEWKNIDLLRVGPHLGLAFEAVIDRKNDEAIELLKKVLTA